MGMNRTFKAAVAAGDYATALRLMRPLAEQGYAYAQTSLGAMYAEGKGVPQDYAAALSWYSCTPAARVSRRTTRLR
jgi:TPR repeat protein